MTYSVGFLLIICLGSKADFEEFSFFPSVCFLVEATSVFSIIFLLKISCSKDTKELLHFNYFSAAYSDGYYVFVQT